MSEHQRSGPPRPISEVVAGIRPSPLHEPHHCKSCSAPIFWARTAAGRSMPVDAAPVADGRVILTDRHGTVIARVLRRDEVAPAGAILRKPHHSTCPQRAVWRRQRLAADLTAREVNAQRTEATRDFH